VVSVVAIGPKVPRLKPSRGNGFLREIKICTMPSFRGEVKPEAPCCKILCYIKNHLHVRTQTLQGQILIPFTHSSYLLPDDFAHRIARELWWVSREFSSIDISP
jgi:hypothetical protein